MRGLLLTMLVACSGPGRSAPTIDNHATPTPPPAPAAVTHRILEFKAVDTEARFTQQLWAHVGFDNHGVPRDPDAAAAGIEGNIDSWEDQAGVRHTDYYLVGARPALERYLAEAAKRDPQLVVPADREVAFEKLASGKVRTYLLEKTAELDEHSVQTATSALDPSTNRPIVLLEFTRAGGEALAKLTERIAGRKLAIITNGVIRSAPIIDAPIRGGRASIAMGGADQDAMENDAAELARRLNRATSH